MYFITGPAMKLGQGYIFTGICDSVHRGVCLSACWDTTPPRTRHPPGIRHTPLGPGTPWDKSPPWDQAPSGADSSRTRHPPPREQTPPYTEHAGRYGQRGGGTFPTGMQSCLCNWFYFLYGIKFLCFSTH